MVGVDISSPFDGVTCLVMLCHDLSCFVMGHLAQTKEEPNPSTSAEPAADTVPAPAPKKPADADLYDDLFDNVWQNSADVVPEIDPEVCLHAFAACMQPLRDMPLMALSWLRSKQGQDAITSSEGSLKPTVLQVQKQSFIQLRKAPSKPKAVHPMVRHPPTAFVTAL